MPLFRRKTLKDDQKSVSQENSPVISKLSDGSYSNGDVFDDYPKKSPEFLRQCECGWPVTTRKRRSRLQPNLEETLQDPSARQNFLDFLHTKQLSHLLQFWLDSESFKSVAKARLAGEELCRQNDQIDNLPTQFGSISLNGVVPKGNLSSPNRCSNLSSKQLAKKLLKNVGEDAVNIFSKYVAKDASFPIVMPDDLRNEVMRRICGESGSVDPGCFEPVQSFVINLLQNDHFQDFVQSVYHFRHQVDVLTGGDVCLTDILYNETSLFYMMEFTELEGQRDLMEFWLAADNFYQHLIDKQGDYNGREAQEDAMVLYDRYFSLQATCPLGFSDAIRLEVEQNICREEGPLPICFERAVIIVLSVLDQVYFRQFLASQLYVKYLGELVNTVQTCDDYYREKKRSGSFHGSDAGSESSLSIVNTLLAMDGTKPGVTTQRRIVQKFIDDDMRIDTGQFVPDSLWRRSYSGKLTIGYVNDVGQFISELEPDPDKKRMGESILTKAVKKFVYKEEDKTKHEMALKVARMIIKEITNLTMRDDETIISNVS